MNIKRRKGTGSMKNKSLVLAIFLMGLGCNQDSMSESLTPEALNYLADRYEFFVHLEAGEGSPQRYILADDAPHVHAYAVEDGRAELVWEITDLKSPVSALMVRDLDKDGKDEILIATQAGHLMAYDASDYHKLFDGLPEAFTRIPCLITANIDQDEEEEMIFIGQGVGDKNAYLYVYDGRARTFEWKTIQPFEAEELLIANVDDDEQQEIILNTGYIIDSLFQTQEPNKVESTGFGRYIHLLDINGDGFPEVIGETSGFSLKVYDLYSQRELW
jgi:hypothetical protein